MRLATIETSGGEIAAAVVLGDVLARVVRADGSSYGDVGELLRAGETGTRDAERALATGSREDLDGVRVLRPVLSPGAIVCVGLNYRTHVLEMGRELPASPTYFSKLARALVDPSDDVELPSASTRIDYEGELVVVIGSGGRNLPEENAWAAVGGLTLMNDVSMRDFQQRTLQWFAGKSWEASTPVGPWMVTPDEVETIDGCELRVTVNDEVRQHARLDDLVFGVPALVADLSRIFELRPGDLIATGTPGGVGEAFDPPRYLEDGDVVEVTVECIGTLRTVFRRR